VIIIGSGILDAKARRRFRLARKAKDRRRSAPEARAFHITPAFRASFDVGLGRRIESRPERREVMRQLGLREA
jgi:hypothetical protein